MALNILSLNYVIDLPSKLCKYGLLSGAYGHPLNSAKVQQQMRDYGVKKIIYDQIHIFNRNRTEQLLKLSNEN